MTCCLGVSRRSRLPENIPGDIQIPDHPLVHEVMKDVLTEAMDVEGLKRLLTGISDEPSVALPSTLRFPHSFRTRS